MYGEDFIKLDNAGIVIKTELWKGGLLVIHLAKSDKSKSTVQINNDHSILESVKKGDEFEKFPNSNKCVLKRNGSVMLIDCINLIRLDKKISDSLSKVDQWKRNTINKWINQTEYKKIISCK